MQPKVKSLKLLTDVKCKKKYIASFEKILMLEKGNHLQGK